MIRERLRDLYARHHGFVWRTCWRYVQNRADADDLAQDVLVKAARSWNTFRGECAETTWLHQIAVNLCRTQLRTRRARQGRLLQLSRPGGEWPYLLPDPDCPPLDDEDGSVAVRVLHSLRGLADGVTRQLVHLSFDRGMPQRGIARATGMPRTTVRRQLARIHNRAYDLFQLYAARAVHGVSTRKGPGVRS
jgi:RNA polymerase sigma factor (sigma-70 family)